jgi:phosphoglycolate phosphatase
MSSEPRPEPPKTEDVRKGVSIIFDFDGTIADSFDLIVDVTYGLTGAVRLPSTDLEKLRAVPILVAIRRLSGSPWRIPKLLALTRSRMRNRMASVPVYPGIPDVLAGLHEAGHRLFILSSNEAPNVAVFLETHGLSTYFDAIYTVPYGNAWFKSRALRKIMRRQKLRPQESYYVGNEVLDIDSARKVGMRSVAVAWGGQPQSELEDAKPDHIAVKPADLASFFQ